MYTVNIDLLREICDSVLLIPVLGIGISVLTVVFVALETLKTMENDK